MTASLAPEPRVDRAFERLYRRHAVDVYRYALGVLRNQADAEDVTQTTFLNAFRALERGERPLAPHNWLIAIAHNVCRQRFRQSARRPHEVSFDEDIGDRYIGVEDEDDTPTADDIRRALGHLAFNQRAALVMRELEGRSYGEIAEILEISPSAVETLIFRARRALREQLESSLTCGEAELAISRQLDGRLSRKEKGALRAHLRECKECAAFARRQRAQRSALRSLAAIPVPASLTSLFGGGGAAVGTGVALKAGAAIATALAVGGAAYVGVDKAVSHARPHSSPQPHAKAPALQPSHALPTQAAPSAKIVAPAASHSRAHRAKPVHGDASVAGRHAHLRVVHAHGAVHVPNIRSFHPVHASGGRHLGPAKPHRHRHASPPGPYIGGPPAGHGKGK
jgi:RNA polymerase sigma-70 factor (ECF subfamily)